jgi:hypothetical protein
VGQRRARRRLPQTPGRASPLGRRSIAPAHTFKADASLCPYRAAAVGRWAHEQAEADGSWAARLEEAHSRWLRERAGLECAAAEKLAAAQELAATRCDALRGQLESRVAVIGERLAGLAAKEGKKDRALKDLEEEVGTALGREQGND